MIIFKFTLFSVLIFNSICIGLAKAPKEIYKNSEKSILFLIDNNKATGTGFFIADNLILTNAHVIENSARVAAINSDKEIFLDIVVIYQNHISDIAILSTKKKSKYHLNISKDFKYEIGDEVYLIGNPKGLSFSFTNGLISQIKGKDYKEILQISAAADLGSSGSPILNSEGDVVGILHSVSRNKQGFNFGASAKSIMKNFLFYQKYTDELFKHEDDCEKNMVKCDKTAENLLLLGMYSEAFEKAVVSCTEKDELNGCKQLYFAYIMLQETAPRFHTPEDFIRKIFKKICLNDKVFCEKYKLQKYLSDKAFEFGDFYISSLNGLKIHKSDNLPKAFRKKHEDFIETYDLKWYGHYKILKGEKDIDYAFGIHNEEIKMKQGDWTPMTMELTEGQVKKRFEKSLPGIKHKFHSYINLNDPINYIGVNVDYLNGEFEDQFFIYPKYNQLLHLYFPYNAKHKDLITQLQQDIIKNIKVTNGDLLQMPLGSRTKSNEKKEIKSRGNIIILISLLLILVVISIFGSIKLLSIARSLPPSDPSISPLPIGGWLYLIGFWTIVSPFVNIGVLSSEIKDITAVAWKPLFQILMYGHLAILATVVIYQFYAINSFFKKSRYFLFHFYNIRVIEFLQITALGILNYYFGEDVTLFIRESIQSLGYLIIWGSYLLISKRSKSTFIV